MSTLWVPLSIRTPPPLTAGFGVPAAGHVHHAGEHVLEHQGRADLAREDHFPGRDDIVREAELRRHGEEYPGLLGGADHLARGLEIDAQGLFAENRKALPDQVDDDAGMGDGRGRDDHRVTARAWPQDPDATP